MNTQQEWGCFLQAKCLPLAISAPARTIFRSQPRSLYLSGRRGPARSALTFQQVRVHVAQHVGDPQLLAGTGATVDVQPGRLSEGSAQRGDGQGTRQSRGQATLRLLGQSAASRAPPPAPAGQPCASGGVHARGRPPSLRGRCWSPRTSAGRAEPACPGEESKALGSQEGRPAQRCEGPQRGQGVGPGAKHRQEGCRESGEGGRGRGRGPWNGAAQVWNGDPERAASQPGPGQTGVGAPVSATDSRDTRLRGLGQRVPKGRGSDWAAGIGDPGSRNSALGCDLWPERTLPHTDPCSSPVSRPQGRYGAAPFRHGLCSCLGQRDPRP